MPLDALEPLAARFPVPQHIYAETGLLGLLLLDNRMYFRVSTFLKPEHFFEDTHAKIFQAIGDLIERGMKATPITLKGILASDSRFDSDGGMAYLARLVAESTTPLSAESYARVVHDYATRRALRECCLAYAAAACTETGGETVEELTAKFLGHAQEVASDTSVVGIRTRRDVMLDVVDSLKLPPPCSPTGLACLDAAMGGGLFAGRTYGIAARRKQGKTALLGTISYNLDAANVRHLYVCLEMGGNEIEHRLMARGMGINPMAFLKHQSAEFVSCAGAYALNAPGGGLHYLDAQGLTFDGLKRTLATAVSQWGVRGFVLDYLQLVRGKAERGSTAEFLDDVANWLAGYAKRERIWGLVACQLNQDNNTRGGEGPALAFDQLYRLNRGGDNEETPTDEAWLEQMASRYTPPGNVGSKDRPALFYNSKGAFFEEQA